MNKAAILRRFVMLAAAAVLLAAVVHAALWSSGLSPLGWLLDAVALGAIAVVSVGTFSPNAPIFGRVVSGGAPDSMVMCLTFDDGPSPEATPRILDALRAAGARATFFILGKHAQQHPELVRRIAAEGHEVASHGWTHNILVFTRLRELRRELDSTADLLNSLGVSRPHYFRTPHGFRSPFLVRVARRAGYRVVGWTRGVFDTARPGTDVIAARSKAALRPGAILLLHDGDGNGNDDRTQTAEALPAILRDMASLGLQSVTISELDRMNRSGPRRYHALLLGGAILAVAALFVAFSGQLSSRTLADLAGANAGLVGLAIAANLVSIGLKATVWQAGLQSAVSRVRIRYPHVVAAIFVGFLLNSALVARAGEPARALVLQRRVEREHHIRLPLATILGTIVVETIVLCATLVLVVLAMALLVPGLPGGTGRTTGILLACLAALGLLVAAIEWLVRRSGAVRPAPSPHSPKLPGRLRAHVERFVADLRQGHQLAAQPGQLAIAVGAGCISWLANLLAIWFALLAFGIHHQAFAVAVIVFVTSNLVGIVQLTPGNVGIFQVTVTLALTQLSGVDRATALAFAVGLQAIEAGLGMGVGLVYLVREGMTIGQMRTQLAVLEDNPGRALPTL